MKIYLDDLMVVLVLVFTIGIIWHGAAYPDGYDECEALAEELNAEVFTFNSFGGCMITAEGAQDIKL